MANDNFKPGDGITVILRKILDRLATGISVGTVSDTIADGADVAQGAKADAAVTDPTTSGSVIALLKGLLSKGQKLGSLTDHSGTITLGGTAQTVMNANASRRYLVIQNVSDTVCWINFGVAAVADQPALKLTPASSYIQEGGFVSTQSISIIGATTGKSFTAKEA